jgi:hypothetical protein
VTLRSSTGQRLTFAGPRCNALAVKRTGLPTRFVAFLWLAIYVVCMGLVCSFILFEVLDIDGSDFPLPSNVATPIKLAGPPHEIKRTPPQLWALLPFMIVLFEATQLRCLGARAVAPSQPGPRGRRGLRIILPRASLADAAPSA